jgi:hypothetical protein
MIVLAFACEWVGGESRAGDECLDAGWFPLEEALGLVQAPQQKAKLLDATHPERSLRYRVYRTRPYETLLEEELCARIPHIAHILPLRGSNATDGLSKGAPRSLLLRQELRTVRSYLESRKLCKPI